MVVPRFINPTILIVDDNSYNVLINRKMIENLNIFKRIDIDILEAENGQIAVDIMSRESNRVKLILMDCEMPIMDGYEASKKIRESGCTVMIMGVSGNSGDQYVRKCKLSGMNGLLSKPININ